MPHIQAYRSVVHGRMTKPIAGMIQLENASPSWRPKIQNPMIQARGNSEKVNSRPAAMTCPTGTPRGWGGLWRGSGFSVWWDMAC